MRGLNPDFEIQRSALGRGEVVRDNQTVGPTNIELEKGGVGEGGAAELRFACGGMAEHGLRFGGRRR